MNFDKIISDMQLLQAKIKDYVINSINKDIIKLEKKKENSNDEFDKQILNLKILLISDILKRFNINHYQNKKEE